jgi:mannose-6-phosphate isomerase-like protein (cupin superfamily)
MDLRSGAVGVIVLGSILAGCASNDAQPSSKRDSASRVAGAPRSAAVDTDTGSPVRASPADGVDYYTAAMLAHIGDSLARGTSTGHMLWAHDGYQYLQIRRATNGVPEVHDRWTDVTFVQAGRGTLRSGGRVAGGQVTTPGEHRGGGIVGGTSRPVGPGDLMIIRAGVPHQYLIAPGDSLRYITTKVLETGAGH